MRDFKVLLINCNTMLDTLVTAGIGILSSSLKNEGIEVKLFDTTFYKTAELTGDDARASVLQVKKTDFKDFGIVPEEGDVIEDFVKLVESFQPAYEEIITWLGNDLENTDPEPQGVWALPQGADYYNQLLSYYTTTDLTAEEVHQIPV